MAEQEPTTEQLAELAASNEEAENPVNYKPPAQKSLQEIQELDKDDESLRKYKETLLGNTSVVASKRSTPSYCLLKDSQMSVGDRKFTNAAIWQENYWDDTWLQRDCPPLVFVLRGKTCVPNIWLNRLVQLLVCLYYQ